MRMNFALTKHASEEMRHAKNDTRRLGTRNRAVIVDVEAIARIGAIVQLDVSGVEQGAQRQRVAVGELPLLARGVRALGQTADRRAVDGTALAVAGASPEGVDRAAACRHGCRNAP